MKNNWVRLLVIFISAVCLLQQKDPFLSDNNIESGFIKISSNSKIFYWLVRKKNNNTEDINKKLSFWFSGGPGCSSLYGAFVENGPYLYNNKE